MVMVDRLLAGSVGRGFMGLLLALTTVAAPFEDAAGAVV